MRGLEDIRGKHAGSPVVIAGSGPSLSKVDERIYRCVVIAIRAATLRLSEADYFMSNDPTGVYTKWWDVLLNERSCDMIVPFPVDCGSSGADDNINVPLRDRLIGYKQRSDPRDWSVGPSSIDVVAGSSSAHCAVHLAAIMGCSPIYLIGHDCRRSENGNMYHWENAGDARGAPKPEHAERMAGYMRDGKHVEPWYHVPGWRQLVKHNPWLKMYDVSGGGLSEIVTQVSYDGMVDGILEKSAP